MNKAIKGNNEEIIYTKLLNKKEKFWDILNYNIDDTFAIHIISKKCGSLNEEKVYAKADIFFAKGNVPKDYLIEKDYYLNEIDCEHFNLKPISKSGLSVKLSNSKYTITKISSNTFFKIFNNNVLAAGSSIYCQKEVEFVKNSDVLNGWNVNESEFIEYFSDNIKDEKVISLHNKKVLEKIKTYSNAKITQLIIESEKISDLIFKGIGNFDEPFTANWIIENDTLKPNYYIPFIITTGSGRSKGTYTIVLKPK